MQYINTQKLSIQLQNILKSYQDYLRVEKGHSITTIHHKIKAVRTFFLRSTIEMVSCITPEVIKEFFYTEVKKNNWSANNQRNYWTYLRCFLNWLIREGKVNLDRNPVELIQKPKKPKTVPRRLSKQQINTLFTVCSTYPWKYDIQRARNIAVFAVFIYTGIRIDELLNIRIEDVSLNDRSILIKKGKGGKRRVVKVPFECKRFLTDYESHTERLKIRREYYFSTVGENKKMTTRDIYAIRDKLSQQTGIYFTPHQLRHTFASNCLEQKIPIASIAKIMGHESIVYTETYLAPEQNILLSHFDNFSPI